MSAAAAAISPPPLVCPTLDALTVVDNIIGGRFVDSSGVSLAAGVSYGIAFPWACASCVINFADIVVPLAACGASPVVVTMQAGTFASDGGGGLLFAAHGVPTVSTVSVGPTMTVRGEKEECGEGGGALGGLPAPAFRRFSRRPGPPLYTP